MYPLGRRVRNTSAKHTLLMGASGGQALREIRNNLDGNVIGTLVPTWADLLEEHKVIIQIGLVDVLDTLCLVSGKRAPVRALNKFPDRNPFVVSKLWFANILHCN